jgi:hypothetical protein
MKMILVAAIAVFAVPLTTFAQEIPDIFDGQARAVARRSNISPQISGSFVGDENAVPKSVFHAGETVCWWSTGIVTPKGTGPVQQNLHVEATTPRRTRTFDAEFTICNTSQQGVCDDAPTFTTWTLGICFGPLPPFIDRILQRTGPVPFDSVISGSGYESWSHTVRGSTVEPLPPPAKR